MTRRRLLIAVALVGAIGGSAAPALANEGDNSRICINATHDKNNPGPAVICVWVPVDKAH
jgi:hypothetical protein